MNNWFDIDRFREILDTLSRNKSRSLLTGFGVFWGVFMLVALIGGGDGLKQLLGNTFDGFATNSALVYPQATTKASHGFRKGRIWTLDTRDVTSLRNLVPELDVISPMVTRWGRNAVYADRKYSVAMKGVRPDFTEMQPPELRYGRYINQMDINLNRKVCVLGKRVYSELFPGGGNPCGKFVRIDSIYYNVVGVDYSTGNMSVNGSAQESIVVPLTFMQQVYNVGTAVDMLCLTGKPGVVMSRVTPRIREVVARNHSLDPTDDKGIMIFNTEELFGMLDNLFSGVNFLIWLVGIGTLLAGAIGVSNIMMVTVRERTTEIGIRRAIGATPRTILSQIVAESLVLTMVAGMSGLLFAVATLQMLEMGTTTDGVTTAHYQIGFWTAVAAVAFISLLGVVAGLAPALRAMSVKPVDAMRDE